MCIYFITIIDFNRHFVNFSNPGLGYRFWIRHLTTDVVEKIQRKCKKLCQLHDMVWFNICKIVLVINLIKKYSDYLQRLSLEAYLELSQISKMELLWRQLSAKSSILDVCLGSGYAYGKDYFWDWEQYFFIISIIVYQRNMLIMAKCLL